MIEIQASMVVAGYVLIKVVRREWLEGHIPVKKYTTETGCTSLTLMEHNSDFYTFSSMLNIYQTGDIKWYKAWITRLLKPCGTNKPWAVVSYNTRCK